MPNQIPYKKPNFFLDKYYYLYYNFPEYDFYHYIILY